MRSQTSPSARSGGRRGAGRSRARIDTRPLRRPLLEGRRVLVVEDDAASAKLLSVILQSEGCLVETAGSAEEALASVVRVLPQIVILDLVLPRMSGLVLAQRLRAEARTRGALIVAVTSFNGTEPERIARLAGCDAYVRKPIEPLTFPRLLAKLMGGKR